MRFDLFFVPLAACGLACSPVTYSEAPVAVELGDYTEVHVLTFAEGSGVRGTPLFLDGRLYVLAGYNGPSSDGVGPSDDPDSAGSLLSVLPDGSDVRVEHAFPALDADGHNVDGWHPLGSPIADPSGAIWGVTQMGGARGAGTLWRYVPGGTFTVEHTFCSEVGCADGKYPMGQVAVLGGDVLGTAKGNVNAGNSFVVFRAGPGGFAHSTSSTAAGWGALGGLVVHGLTPVGVSLGGLDGGRGAYFVVDPVTLVATPIRPFAAFTTGQYGTDNTPEIVPLVVSNGDVLVARNGGPYGYGSITKPETGQSLVEMADLPFTAVPRFSNDTGGVIMGNLVEGADGLVYGTAMYGGDFGTGVIYRIARDGSLFQVVHSFASDRRPYGGLALGPDGALYGVTWSGRAVFRFRPSVSAVCN